MSRIKSKNTRMENVFRSYIRNKGIRGCRINSKNIFGKPDLFFGKKKIAVFIDGCFWHKCPKCFNLPKSNFGYWSEKLERNVQRAKEVNKVLKEERVKVIRFWGHEVEKNIEKCYKRLEKELKIKQYYK